MNHIFYKRLSSDRSETIEVVRSSLDDWPETFLTSLAAEGAEVFTENPDLLRVFGTARTDLDEADAALRAIKDAGGIVVGIRLRYLSDGIKAAFSRREDPADNPDIDTAGFITFGSGISPARNVFSSTGRFFPIACVSTRRRILSSVNMRQSAMSASSMYVSGKQRAPIAWSWWLCVRNTVSGKSVMWRMKSATSSMP